MSARTLSSLADDLAAREPCFAYKDPLTGVDVQDVSLTVAERDVIVSALRGRAWLIDASNATQTPDAARLAERYRTGMAKAIEEGLTTPRDERSHDFVPDLLSDDDWRLIVSALRFVPAPSAAPMQGVGGDRVCPHLGHVGCTAPTHDDEGLRYCDVCGAWEGCRVEGKTPSMRRAADRARSGLAAQAGREDGVTDDEIGGEFERESLRYTITSASDQWEGKKNPKCLTNGFVYNTHVTVNKTGVHVSLDIQVPPDHDMLAKSYVGYAEMILLDRLRDQLHDIVEPVLAAWSKSRFTRPPIALSARAPQPAAAPASGKVGELVERLQGWKGTCPPDTYAGDIAWKAYAAREAAIEEAADALTRLAADLDEAHENVTAWMRAYEGLSVQFKRAESASAEKDATIARLKARVGELERGVREARLWVADAYIRLRDKHPDAADSATRTLTRIDAALLASREDSTTEAGS